MSEVLRFAKFPAGGRGTFRPKFVALLLFASSLLIQTVSAQVPPSQQKKSPQGNAPAPTDTPPPPPAQIWLPPLQNPEHAPVIEWDGRLLTIDAENSSLADVMLGIRSRTGASIDMPASANRERIAVHLGPAPIREVLSSLLYGTDFNYVVQSSEDDEDALGKVILIPRDGDASPSQDMVADEGRPKSKIRLMPGYAAPGKRDFEVAHSHAMEDSSSSVADTPVVDTPAAEAPVTDSASVTPDQPAGAAVVDSASTNASTDTQPSTSESADSSSPANTNTNMLTASGQPLSTGTAAISSNSSSSTGGGTTIVEMEQNLQNLYKQRQQLQAQQNRTVPPPQTNAP